MTSPSPLAGIAGFTYTALPARVVFGAGTLACVAEEVVRLGCRRALVLSTSQQGSAAAALAKRLGDLSAGVFAGAVMHTPVDVTNQALAEVRARGVDCLVAIGGGSTTGLGKALALRTDLPQVVVATTYAGSEATPILGETEGGRKSTQRNAQVLPEVIVYDVDLTLGLPVGLSVTSGMNAIAHAVEALYAQDANPVTSAFAEQGIATLARALPAIVVDPGDRAARRQALYGAWLCGTCLGAVGMGLHHKLCHVLGGTFDLPHAETHAVMLPHFTAYNTPAAREAMARVARALGCSDPARGLFDLARDLGAPTSLRELGMPADGVERVVELAVAEPYPNPRPVERAGIRALLRDAYDGSPPLAPSSSVFPAETEHA